MNSDLITTRKTHQFSSRQLIVGFEEIKLSTEELRKKECYGLDCFYQYQRWSGVAGRWTL